VNENAVRVLNLANQHCAKQQGGVLKASIQRLHDTTELVVKTLSAISREKSVSAGAD
jgi:hypothetical protein